LEAITGIHRTWQDLEAVGERIWNLTRLYWLREIEGFGRSWDMPASRFYEEPPKSGATAGKITRYLVANAGDAGGQRYSSKLLKGVAAGVAPQRITELPRWVSEHRKVPDWEWRHKDVRTRANCVACHTAAEQGDYDE
jgi:hypothetical protein